MSLSHIFQDAFAKSPKPQLIVSGYKISVANHAACNLLAGTPETEALEEAPVDAVFVDAEKCADLERGSGMLTLRSPQDGGPIACNVIVTKVDVRSRLWNLEPIWKDQIESNGSALALERALHATADAVICVSGRNDGGTERDFVVRFANRAAETFLGSGEGRAAGRQLQSVFPFFSDLDLDSHFEEAMEGTPSVFQESVVSAEGVRTELSVSIFSSRDGDFVICLRDVTEAVRVQSKLERSTNELDRLSNQVPGVYFHLSMDESGTPSFPYISEKVQQLLGVEASAVMEDASVAMGAVCIEDLERVYESLAVSSQHLTPLHIEYRINTPNGRQKWVATKAIPEKRSDKTVVWYGIFEDITLRKESEERLRMVSAAVEASSDFVLMVDREGEALYRNNSFVNIVGYQTIDVLNDKGGVKALFGEKHVYDKILQETLEYGHWQGDVQVMTESGRQLDIYFRSVSVKDEKGRVSALVVTGTDVTHNKRRQNLLKRYNSVLKAQSEAATDGILVVNERGIVSNFNRRFCKIWGLSTNLMDVGRPEKIWSVASKQVEDSKAFFERAMMISENESETFKDVLEFADGRTFERTSIPISSPLGESYGRVWFFHEVTEQKRSEERLRATMREAEEANRAKSFFLANMSHEIRTPMNGIIGMTGLLAETALENEQQDYVDTIRASSEALLVVINDILDFSKIESGKLELENIMFDLRDTIEEAIDTLAIQATEKGLDISYVFGNEIPGSLLGDPTRLRQVIVNLIGNAVKFTAKGGVVVRVDPFHVKGDDVILHFQVTDTGIGIPADRIDRLFGSFSQVDASTTRKYGGTGLGLAISKNLAELMGGSMWVESEEGVGSTFHFTVSFNRASFDFDLGSSKAPNVLEARKAIVLDHHGFSCEALSSQLEVFGVEVQSGTKIGDLDDLVAKAPDAEVVFVESGLGGLEYQELKTRIRKSLANEELTIVFTGRLGSMHLGEHADGNTLSLLKPYKLENVRSRMLEAGGKAAPRVKKVSNESVKLGEQMPLRILLAEDNAINQKVANRLFKKMGYEISVAQNGLEAVNMIGEHEYDLVFMDIQMPEMDGLEATREIIKRWGEKRPRIIALTANAMREDRENCFGAGMDGYLTKPFKPDDLKETISKTYRHLHENNGDPSGVKHLH
ncbi:ATP-binding protein [Pelagicoccus enzymogenes]|uniref:PAS domain-containing hybrid sensor histidine kinase/response regulator n=1 Tax=Pelagicoccus enzymogenes TaxID=2773457 RepID=UPI00280D90A8|nr:ATP-binding protein [Pelagicoccus enzymogenes]MDQ8197510.1 ATP-binding protein [Pelagicoccus enzymogenes]